MTRWDETGHKTCPAACFVPVESEPHAGGEVGRGWTHNMSAACFVPVESGRNLWGAVFRIYKPLTDT